MIYFIQIEESGPIKVGYTFERTAIGRLGGLQVACPWRLILRGVIEGDETEELKILTYLAAHRMRGEWFEPHPFVIETIQGLIGKWDAPEGSSAMPSCNVSSLPHLPDSDLNELIHFLARRHQLRPIDVLTEAVRDGLNGALVRS